MAWRFLPTLLLLLPNAVAFVTPALTTYNFNRVTNFEVKEETITFMAKGPSGGGKKKRRRRKQPPTTSTVAPPVAQNEASTAPVVPLTDVENIPVEDGSSQPPASIEELRSIANFSRSSNMPKPSLDDVGGAVGDDQFVELPDIRDTLKRKELKRIEEETQQERKRPKISRKDRAAFLQVRGCDWVGLNWRRVFFDNLIQSLF